MEKRPIISTLRGMKPGDRETFPIEQRCSVVNTYSTTMVKEKKEGWLFSYKTDVENGTATITRIR